MTLLDLNQVYRKLAQAIREYKTGNFTCLQFMGRKVQRVLEHGNYLQTIQKSLGIDSSAIEFYAPTTIERATIASELANFQELSKMPTD